MFGWLTKLFRGAPQAENDPKEKTESLTPASAEGVEVFENSSESLIEYLRLKSKQTMIKQEKFNLNNVLNELSGSLSNDFMDSGVELIFDVDREVPRYMIGDSLQLEKILESLTRGLIEKNPQAQVEIKISQYASSEDSQSLSIVIVDQGVHLSREELKAFTVPYYDEVHGTYIKLGFYVTREIVALMDGTLDVKSDPKRGTLMQMVVPFAKDKSELQRKYRLPSRTMVGKKVFLVDDNYSSALAIKKMLSYFRYTVDILSAEYFREKKVDLSPYDIAIFDEVLFEPYVVRYLKNLKMSSGLKVVLLSSIFRSGKNKTYEVLDVVDAAADKPFSQERIFEMILDLDRNAKREKSIAPLDNTMEHKPEISHKIHRALFENKAGVSTESFSVFAGNTLLVVDDNRINQKIVLHVLGKSGMHIETANDGRKAVDMLMRKDKKYDLILMDINMPILDGYAATAEIRRESVFSDIPIIALTTLILESEIEKMFGHGVSGYLSKPLEVGRLYTAFEFFLAKSGSSKDVAKTRTVSRKHFDRLDVFQGIRYAGGNEVVYREILKEFVVAYGQSADLIRHLTDDRNYAQVKILCGDMKNLANTIGANKMHEIADEMYKLLLYSDEQKVPQYIESYRRELEKLRHSIEAYLKGSV